MIYYAVQENFAFIVAITFLMLFIFSNRLFDKQITNLFMISVVLTLLLFVVENLSEWYAAMPSPTFMRRFTSAAGYSIRPVIIVGIILIVYRVRIKKLLILCIPAIINTCISFTGLFCDITFGFSEQNVFYRGPLGYTAHVTALIYFVVLVVATIRFFREKSYYEGVLIVIVEISNVVATVLESVWGYKGLLRTSIVLSIAFYYIHFQTQSTKRDSLTGALKRRYLYIDAERMKGRLQAVISLDLNDLKYLNDTYGHTAGDKAISTLVNCVESTILHGFTLYRTGGDEFIILCRKCEQKKIDDFIKKLKNEIAKTPYSCAIGYAMFGEHSEFEDVCKKADEAMYADKILIKGEGNIR